MQYDPPLIVLFLLLVWIDPILGCIKKKKKKDSLVGCIALNVLTISDNLDIFIKSKCHFYYMILVKWNVKPNFSYSPTFKFGGLIFEHWLDL